MLRDVEADVFFGIMVAVKEIRPEFKVLRIKILCHVELLRYNCAWILVVTRFVAEKILLCILSAKKRETIQAGIVLHYRSRLIKLQLLLTFSCFID